MPFLADGQGEVIFGVVAVADTVRYGQVGVTLEPEDERLRQHRLDMRVVSENIRRIWVRKPDRKIVLIR